MTAKLKRKIKIIKHLRYIERKNAKKSFREYNYSSKRLDAINKMNQLLTYSSSVLSLLEHSQFGVKHRFTSSNANLNVPKVFCFSKNPDESIRFLRLVYSIMMDFTITNIHFNHFSCEYIGVCASTIMDIIVLEGIRLRRSKGIYTNFSGDLKNNLVSESREVDTLIKSSGLLNHLGLSKGNYHNIEKLTLIKGGDSAEVSEKTIEYINRSLYRHGYILTKLGANLFGSFVGEIVDNCSLHGGDNVAWYTLGHYSFDSENHLGKCKLCIIDFGDTIYESLKYNSNKKMLKQINHYSRKKWYSFKTVKSEETLYALFSLQQRVSRIISKNAVRGNGTVTFIDSVLKLFNTTNQNYKSIFSITSGKASILFDGKYVLKEQVFGENYSNKIIAFNDENDLSKEPDSRYVRTLNNSFPGTVISMDLYIDNKYLEGVN